MRLALLTPPALEPVTLAEAKAHARIETTADDALVTALIVAARQAAEQATGRALIHQAWRLTLDRWPGAPLAWWDGVHEGAVIEGAAPVLAMARPPLASVTAIRVFAADDTPATVAPAVYRVDAAGIPGRIHLREGQSWPLPGRSRGGIEIDYLAGHGPAAADVPQAIRAGILAEVARLYEERGDGEGRGPSPLALALWRPWRILGV